ncbi:TerB family tellurite resistance protein [Pelagibacterium lacus]|uniref:TerB family tellurite resistance protein n=1 Tax=Pelagibacterium lacus TaxID=2282655 RepID=A0A369W4P5_9HYPH|nr:TerB family tellurite resistance protein [Pelagibacterium lacus]
MRSGRLRAVAAKRQAGKIRVTGATGRLSGPHGLLGSSHPLFSRRKDRSSVFEAISRLFGGPEKATGAAAEPRLAVAALLIHLAAVDGAASAVETAAIARALRDHYGLDDGEVKRLIAEARRRDREAVDFYQFTTQLARLSDAEKAEIVRMMWQVVFVDDTNHELEDNMVWRVAELIGVSTRQRTLLRNEARRATTPPDPVGD